MAKQTAMQELRFFVSNGLNDYDESIKVSEIWNKINQLLEKEKQQIKDAYNSERDLLSRIEDSSAAEEYYQETYG